MPLQILTTVSYVCMQCDAGVIATIDHKGKRI